MGSSEHPLHSMGRVGHRALYGTHMWPETKKPKAQVTRLGTFFWGGGMKVGVMQARGGGGVFSTHRFIVWLRGLVRARHGLRESITDFGDTLPFVRVSPFLLSPHPTTTPPPPPHIQQVHRQRL